MCVIVDANRAGVVFAPAVSEDFEPLRRWLDDPDKDGILVYGGKLAAELQKSERSRRYLRALFRAGRARRFSSKELIAEEGALRNSAAVKSNDPHVLALARLSGARTLCSEDLDLHADFKNPDLISKPRGKIYRRADHAHLLTHTTSCRQRSRSQRG